jgi:hypothetical protein
MSTTVYTYNDKVLKNVATDKWLKKPDAPAGFVMNASNATITVSGYNVYVSWQSPTYPNAYNGGGKQYILVNTNETAPQSNSSGLMYGNSATGAGPDAISRADMAVLGTSSGTLVSNSTPPEAGFGTHLVWNNIMLNPTVEKVQAYLANVTITILDP